MEIRARGCHPTDSPGSNAGRGLKPQGGKRLLDDNPIRPAAMPGVD